MPPLRPEPLRPSPAAQPGSAHSPVRGETTQAGRGARGTSGTGFSHGAQTRSRHSPRCQSEPQEPGPAPCFWAPPRRPVREPPRSSPARPSPPHRRKPKRTVGAGAHLRAAAQVPRTCPVELLCRGLTLGESTGCGGRGPAGLRRPLLPAARPRAATTRRVSGRGWNASGGGRAGLLRPEHAQIRRVAPQDEGKYRR